MTYTQNDVALIKTTLAEMIAQAEKLARITADEGAALRNAEIELINQRVKDKRDLVTGLVETDNRFRKQLSQCGYTSNEEIHAFLNRLNYANELEQSWRNYVKIMQRCDQLNKQNSALVNVGLRHTRQAIDFLRSCVGEYADPDVYGPRTKRTAGTNYVIAKA